MYARERAWITYDLRALLYDHPGKHTANSNALHMIHALHCVQRVASTSTGPAEKMPLTKVISKRVRTAQNDDIGKVIEQAQQPHRAPVSPCVEPLVGSHHPLWNAFERLLPRIEPLEDDFWGRVRQHHHSAPPVSCFCTIPPACAPSHSLPWTPR